MEYIPVNQVNKDSRCRFSFSSSKTSFLSIILSIISYAPIFVYEA